MSSNSIKESEVLIKLKNKKMFKLKKLKKIRLLTGLEPVTFALSCAFILDYQGLEGVTH